MPILAFLEVVMQFGFAIHVIRSGRNIRWLYIIMAAPVLGCVLYYFIEIYPGSREHRKADRAVKNIIRKLDPDKGLREKVAELEVCGSVDNKLALAAECMQCSMFDDAIKLYRSCLTGMHANDPHIQFALAKALTEKQELVEVLAITAELRSKHPAFRPADTQMLAARALEAQGRHDEALAEYRVLAEIFVGEEGRWRYGALLRQMGRTEDAVAVFEGMLRSAKRMPANYREEQREWLVLAKQSVTV